MRLLRRVDVITSVASIELENTGMSVDRYHPSPYRGLDYVCDTSRICFATEKLYWSEWTLWKLSLRVSLCLLEIPWSNVYISFLKSFKLISCWIGVVSLNSWSRRARCDGHRLSHEQIRCHSGLQFLSFNATRWSIFTLQVQRTVLSVSNSETKLTFSSIYCERCSRTSYRCKNRKYDVINAPVCDMERSISSSSLFRSRQYLLSRWQVSGSTST